MRKTSLQEIRDLLPTPPPQSCRWEEEMPELNVRWSDINHDSILLSGQARRKAATEGAESFSTNRGHRAMLPWLLAESQT